jgi:hypothetical protein
MDRTPLEQAIVELELGILNFSSPDFIAANPQVGLVIEAAKQLALVQAAHTSTLDTLRVMTTRFQGIQQYLNQVRRDIIFGSGNEQHFQSGSLSLGQEPMPTLQAIQHLLNGFEADGLTRLAPLVGWATSPQPPLHEVPSVA